MDILNEKNQSFSSILADWQMCGFCHIVDHDRRRSQVGCECPTCGQKSEGGELYFEMAIHVLLDLIQETYHSDHELKVKYSDFKKESNAHFISIILFYCSLREVLLSWLLRQLCSAQKIPESIYKRLMADNNTHMLRQNNLLPSLVGMKWSDVLKQLDDERKRYSSLNDTIKEMAEVRNKFMHEGYPWAVNKTLAEKCILSLEDLIDLYVDMQNKFVHPYYM